MFSKLTAQSLRPNVTQRLVLNQLDGDPVLVVQHLGESNGAFWSDAIARANTEELAGGAKKKLTPERIAAARAENRNVVAKYAVVALENVFHDDGTPASAEDIPAVVAAIPDDVFDTVVAFCRNPNNFRDFSPAKPADIAKK